MIPCILSAPRRSLVGSAGLLACLASLCLAGGASAQPRETWKGQPNDISDLALSPDGKTLASSTLNGKYVTLWDFASGKVTATLTLDPTVMLGVGQFTPDGAGLLTFSSTPKEGGQGKEFLRSVQIWDLATQKVRLSIDFPDGVGGSQITPDGKSLIAVGWKTGRMMLYELSTGKPSEPIDLGDDYRDTLSWQLSPDGKTLAVVTSPGAVHLWDMEKNATRATIPASATQGARTLVFSPDGKTLATSNGGGATVLLWDAADGKPADKLDFGGRVICIKAIAFSPDGKTVAVGGMHWGVSLWDLAAGGERDDFGGDIHTGLVRCVVFTPDGKTLISGGDDTTKDKAIWFWDVPQGKPAGVKTPGRLTPAEAKQLKDMKK